ncbi:DnaJ domain-containing protein, partial [Gaertneriomyces semiglobifer]
MTESTDEIRSEDERTMEEETEETEATATEVDLYAEFGLEKTATQAEIKKAYHKVALRFHPDKITAQGLNDEEVMQATQRFQRILKYYEILSDPTKRERYDQTGSIDDESYSLPPDAGSWGAYFRDLWSGIVNEETIAEFAKDYKESEEERKDILKAYNDYEGDFWKLYETVFLLEFDDVPRVIDTIKAAIDAGEIQKYKKFASTTTQREINKHRKAAEKEAKEAEEMLQEIRKTQKIKASKAKKGSGEELKALMQARSKDRF